MADTKKNLQGFKVKITHSGCLEGIYGEIVSPFYQTSKNTVAKQGVGVDIKVDKDKTNDHVLNSLDINSEGVAGISNCTAPDLKVELISVPKLLKVTELLSCQWGPLEVVDKANKMTKVRYCGCSEYSEVTWWVDHFGIPVSGDSMPLVYNDGEPDHLIEFTIDRPVWVKDFDSSGWRARYAAVYLPESFREKFTAFPLGVKNATATRTIGWDQVSYTKPEGAPDHE